MEMLVGLLCSKLNMSKFVVTDRENAVINVVAKGLPKIAALLCYFHIERM